MAKVTTQMSMSLDGFISGPNESGFEHLFEWYGNRDVTIPTANPDMPPSQVSQASADYLGVWDDIGAIVVGRHLFDVTNGWDGHVIHLRHRRPRDCHRASKGCGR